MKKNYSFKTKSTILIFLIYILNLIFIPIATAKEATMISIRKSDERGLSQYSWLKSFHTFSFAGYHDPKHMGFRALRVINEDTIQGGKGFDTHAHKDMEIITYVTEGALEHQDSMGNKSVINAGEVQRMSAGSGVMHSEHNHDKNDLTHLYQIWIMPNQKSTSPSYGQKSFESALQKNNLVLVVSKEGRDGSISIQQDADLYISRLKKGEVLEFKSKLDRHIWVQVIRGKIKLNNIELNSGDALSSSENDLMNFQAMNDAEFMIFDLS